MRRREMLLRIAPTFYCPVLTTLPNLFCTRSEICTIFCSSHRVFVGNDSNMALWVIAPTFPVILELPVLEVGC